MEENMYMEFCIFQDEIWVCFWLILKDCCFIVEKKKRRRKD